MSNNSGFAMFGLITGILSTTALCIGAVRMFLPSVKMRELDGLLDETESLFHDSHEQGLLKERGFIEQTQQHLAFFRRKALFMRFQVHLAETPLQELWEMSKGLSLEIGVLCRAVKKVRATISATSEEERRRTEEIAVQPVEHSSSGSMSQPLEVYDASDRLSDVSVAGTCIGVNYIAESDSSTFNGLPESNGLAEGGDSDAVAGARGARATKATQLLDANDNTTDISHEVSDSTGTAISEDSMYVISVKLPSVSLSGEN